MLKPIYAFLSQPQTPRLTTPDLAKYESSEMAAMVCLLSLLVLDDEIYQVK